MRCAGLEQRINSPAQLMPPANEPVVRVVDVRWKIASVHRRFQMFNLEWLVSVGALPAKFKH